MTIKKCEQCKKEFRKWGNPRLGSAYRFCGKQCYWDSMTIKLECKICGISFKRKSNGVLKYCYDCWENKKVPAWNQGKSNYWAKGSRNNNWRGGVSKLQDLIRGSIPAREWRRQILKRDKYRCTQCGIFGKGDLHIDHIKPLALILKQQKIRTLNQALLCEEIWDIKNGRVLCIDCHKATDSYGIKFLLNYGGLD